MNIALIGASGFVGSSIMNEALSRGHYVTAIVRNPDKIKIQNPKLSIKKTDLLKNDISEIVAKHDAIVSAYNSGWQNPNIYEDFLKGYDSILKAAKNSKVKRIIVVGGSGSLEVSPGVQLVDSPDFPLEWKQGALAARELLAIFKKEKELEWTFVSPAIMLEPGERTGKFQIGKDKVVYNNKGESKISVADLAVAIINELEKPQFKKQRFTIAY